ncbi:MAG: MFS transporter [Pseudomonadales bacterium]
MNSQERRTALIVGLLYFVRMLGLFSILPVFALAAADLFDSGPAVIGLTLGIYGLFQAVLQIPLGALSDRFGRKPILIGGLFIFIVGSLIAGMAERVELVVLGRALQGSGAIAGVLLAVVGDGLRLEYRARAMAMIGGGIGMAFGFSLVVGSLLYQFGGLAALFFLAAATGFAALVLVVFLLPEQDVEHRQVRSSGGVSQVLRDGALQTLNLSIFMNHFLLMAGFVVIPALLEEFGLLMEDHAWVYLGLLVGSFFLMLPLIFKFRGSTRLMTQLSPAVLMIGASVVTMAVSGSLLPFLFALLIFFVGFNYLEATLPTLVSQFASEAHRGAAMGAYSSAQFLGIFAGGSLGGLLLASSDITTLVLANIALVGFWMAILLFRGAIEKKTV